MEITSRLKNYLLNKSGQYRFYKSEYMKLKNSTNKQELAIKDVNDKIIDDIPLPKKLIKPIDKEEVAIKVVNDEILEDVPLLKKLKDIRTSYQRDCLENVSIGEYTYGHPHIECFVPEDKLSIGKFCSIANKVTILIGMDHPVQCGSTFPFGPFMNVKPYSSDETQHREIQKTIIGNDVWIGYDALILSGVKIGDGAVIGARTVVSKDVEPYSIVAGSPLRMLRYRFPKYVREALLKHKWWDLPDEKIEELAPYLLQPDMDILLEKLQSL